MLHVGSLSDVFGAWEKVILFEQFAGSSATHPPPPPQIRGRMKSLGPNQKQLIRNQWELNQLFAVGTQRAEVSKAG